MKKKSAVPISFDARRPNRLIEYSRKMYKESTGLTLDSSPFLRISLFWKCAKRVMHEFFHHFHKHSRQSIKPKLTMTAYEFMTFNFLFVFFYLAKNVAWFPWCQINWGRGTIINICLKRLRLFQTYICSFICGHT